MDLEKNGKNRDLWIYKEKEKTSSRETKSSKISKFVNWDREMADVIRKLLDSGKLSDETCRSILLGLGKEVDKSSRSSSSSEYCRQVQESQGFDIDRHLRIPRGGIYPCELSKYDPSSGIVMFGRFGVHCFNFHKERCLKFMRIPKYNTLLYNFAFTYYITVDVEDLADNSAHTLQTKVTECHPRNDASFNIRTLACRLKPDTPEPLPRVDDEVVDEKYNGRMPNFVDGVPPEDRLRFYEVQEQDMLENDWLRLYTDFALFCFWRNKEKEYKSSLPVEINKIVVETFETNREPCMKLQSGNAIFHISFTAKSRDYISVVRRTTAEKSSNMMLEINTWDLEGSSA